MRIWQIKLQVFVQKLIDFFILKQLILMAA